jgi:Flp pilus assembly CpaE family ATPase
MSDVSIASLTAASVVWWVTTPEYASVHDSLQAFQALRSISRLDDRLRIVLNTASSEIEVRPDSIEQALGAPIFWTVPYDRAVRRVAQAGHSLVETDARSAAAAAVIGLAEAVGGTPSSPAQHPRDGLLSRILPRRHAASGQWQEARA